MIKGLRLAFCAALIAFAPIAQAEEQHKFNDIQLDNMQYAYSFGEQYDKHGKAKAREKRYDNNGLGYIMAALVWRESSAGIKEKGKKGHEAYGMFQNYLPTIRSRVDKLGWKMTDRQIIKMMGKRSNSAAWAYIELSYWLDVHKGDMRKAIASYNAGWKFKAGDAYASDVLKKANYLKSHKMFKVVIE